MLQKRYKAQALAIAMVVLVVSSIIAMSVYSRIAKDKALSIDERASAEALQVSDLILNYLTSFNIIDIITQATDATATNLDTTLTENSSSTEISQLLNDLGSTENVNALSVCPLSTGTNEYFLNIKEGDENTFFEVRPGQILAIPIKNMPLGDTCTTNLYAVVKGDSQAGFTLTSTYAKDYDSNGVASVYKPYDETDVVNYCFSSDGTTCNNTDFDVADNWRTFRDDNTETISSINLKQTSGEYVLDEIKLTAIGGTVGFSYIINEGSSCTDSLRIIQIQAGANCDGVYRGKTVLLPEKQWESPIFNYVVFNGEGTL